MLVIVILGALLPGGGLYAQAGRAAAPADTERVSEVFLSVKGRSRVMSIALVPFAADPSDAEQARLAAELFAVLVQDLRNAVRFEVLVDSAGVDSSGWGPVVERWSAAGARALVRGALQRHPDHLELFATLYRLPDSRMLISRAYAVLPLQTRAAAHRLSDDIVYILTGQRGIAQSRIAFVAPRQEHKEIFVMDYDGHDPHPVTGDKALALSPGWSPDGRRLVYSSLQQGKWELYLLELASGQTAFLPTPSRMNTAPTWSPDGQRILFAMYYQGNIDLYTTTVPGGRLQRLTDHLETDTEPEWSPDGRRIAFISDRTGLPQVYLAAADGGEVRRLTWEPDAYEGSPSWSPDGRRIAFVRRGFDGFDIYLADLEGGPPLRLTAGDSNENPGWSPDGLQLVFCCTKQGKSDIYAMNWDGGNLRQLTTSGNSLMPSWSSWPVGDD